VLADYVDEGGRVVDLMFALDPNWGYLGRFRAEGYSAMTLSGTSYVTSCLGNYDPTDPPYGGHRSRKCVRPLPRLWHALTADSHEVARWQDDELFVAAKDDDSVVSISGYVGIYYQWTGQMADVLHNAILWLPCCFPGVSWLAEEPVSGTVPAEGSLPVEILFDASPAGGVTQPGSYVADLIVRGEPKVTVPVIMTVEPPVDWGRIEGTVMGLGYCDANPYPAEEAMLVITGSSGNSWTLAANEAGHWVTWLESAENPLTIDVTFPQHLPGQATGVLIEPGGNVVVDLSLRWDRPCMSVDPLSLSVTLDLGAYTTVPLTLTNDGAGTGSFCMSDEDTGYVPMWRGFLPPAVRPKRPDTTPTSIGRAPGAPTASPGASGRALVELAGEPAFAVDTYPGYNLVYFYDDDPGEWTIVAPEPGNQWFAGDLYPGDNSTLYVIDYGTNSLYAVDTTTRR
jgi:hypothetical protein